MNDTLIIPAGFNGPRLSGNGGYVGGMMANRFGGNGAVEITLRAPVPIETAMTLSRGADGALLLHDGETLVCEARAGSVDHLAPPPAPTDWDEVLRFGEEGGSPPESDFGECIVCGRGRAVGDGLRVLGLAGPQPGHSLSCYLPHANHADATGRIRPEFVWGTLDCPGAFAAQDPDDLRPALTGRMTVKVMDRPRVGERCAVVGWRIGAEGRKLYSGTALYTDAGKLCALGTCTWILLRS
ncbi:MAG: hypothetical protein EXR12_17410 [Rhodospirillaceae bacterium]|nr:hypothetical protein [Rhodospirillaceae bacterium]